MHKGAGISTGVGPGECRIGVVSVYGALTVKAANIAKSMLLQLHVLRDETFNN